MSKSTIFTREACRGHLASLASLPTYFNPLRLIALSLILTLIAPPATQAQSVLRPSQLPPPPIPGPCFSSSPDNIIPAPCLPDLGVYTKAGFIAEFQQQALQDYLDATGIPWTQTQFYSLAGRSLRDEVRAFMFLELQDIISRPAAQRSAMEQEVYDWFDAWMTHFEVQLYTLGHAEYSQYRRDPCAYSVDTKLQEFVGFEWDTLNCSNLGSIFFPPKQPSAEYYRAAGYRQSFGSLSVDTGVATTLQHLAPYSQIGLFAGQLGAVAIATPVVLAFQRIAPFAGRAILDTSTEAAETVAEVAADSAGTAVGEGFTAGAAGGGVFAIAAAGLMILIEGAIEFSEIQNIISGLATFDSDFATKTAPGYKYDLSSSSGDAQQQAKMSTVWSYLSSNGVDKTPATLPDPSTNLAVSTGHFQVTFDQIQHGYLELDMNANYTGTVPAASDHFQSTDWEGRIWSVSLYGDRNFLKTCISPSPELTKSGKPVYPCYGPEVARTIETKYPNINSVGGLLMPIPTFYNGLISRIDGKRFHMTMTGTSDDPTLYTACPANPLTGVSDLAGHIPLCNGWVDTVAYVYNNGYSFPDPTVVNMTKVTTLATPVFSSASDIGFIVGQPRQFQVQAASPLTPGATMTYSTGSCGLLSEDPPAGMTFNSQGLLSYNGGTVPTGTSVFHVCARLPNNGPNAAQTLNITMGTQSGFASATQLTVFSGIPFSRKIFTSGFPAPSITITNLGINDVFGFVHFQDNGDGSATVSGTLPYPFQLATALCIPASPFGPGTCPFLTATSVTGSVTAPFNVVAVTAPGPVPIVPPINFIAGTANSLLITTSGSVTTPVLSALPPGGFVPSTPAAVTSDTTLKNPLSGAPWLTFRDNGNGTATLAGTPPVGTTADLGLRLVFNAQWVFPSFADVTVHVRDTPAFTNNPNAIFKEGVPGSVTLTTASPATITAANASLPSGVTINGTTVSGTPAAQTAGYYPIPCTATNGNGSITQPLNLFVLAPPGIRTSVDGQPNSLFVQAGAVATINLTTAGFPKSTPPSSWPKELGTGMLIRFTTNMPPSSYTFAGTTDLTGNLNGSGRIRFAPSAAQTGLYTATLSAANGVAPDASLPLTITVVKAGDTNHDGTVDCSDFTIVRNALGKIAGKPGYDVRADINYDGIVDVRDFSFVSAHLSQGTVCH